MTPSLNICVTSGGTRVPLDDVRLISNISHGATGAAIATYALEQGHHVDYIANSDTCLPYIGNPLSDAWRGLQRTNSTASVTDFVRKQATGQLSLHRAEDFSAYMQMVDAIVQPSNNIDAIILSAAVSDFGPDRLTPGKISSRGAIALELSPLPKIRERIRGINPNIIIIAFKQMPLGTTEDELLDVAMQSMTRGGIDLTVANITASVAGSFSARSTWILHNDGNSQKINRRELPQILIEQELPRLIHHK